MNKILALIIAALISVAAFGACFFLLHPPAPAAPVPDNDGMPNSWEMRYGLNMYDPKDAKLDRDGDRLTNLEEFKSLSNPNNPDIDGDDLSDGEEIKKGTDPRNPDTDEDGLTDGAELRIHKTDPKSPDTDGDQLRDGVEVEIFGSNPLNPDTEGDGLTDGVEVYKHRSSPTLKDTDEDGLNDNEEIKIHKTDPALFDTDGDFLSDGEEIAHKTNPLNLDSDVDGLEDGLETDWSVDTDKDGLINALDPDSDNDWLKDGEEIPKGANPLDPDTDKDRAIDGWDPVPFDEDADDDGLRDGWEATNWAYWFITEEKLASKGKTVRKTVDVEEGRYKLLVRSKGEAAIITPTPLILPITIAANVNISLIQDGVKIVEDSHLLNGLYRWYSTPFFNAKKGKLRIEISGSGGLMAKTWVNRCALLKIDSINRELTDPLDPDTDNDGIKDSAESVFDAYWYEAEDFAYNPQQIEDTVFVFAKNQYKRVGLPVSNSRHIKSLHDMKLCRISDPNSTYPKGKYDVFVRAKSVDLNGRNSIRVKSYVDGMLVADNTTDLVRSVQRDSTSIDVNLYEWFFVHEFSLTKDGKITIDVIDTSPNNGSIRVDEILLIQFKPWPVPGFPVPREIEIETPKELEEYEEWEFIRTVLFVPRGITNPMNPDTDGDGFRIENWAISGSRGWLTDEKELKIGTNPFDVDTDRDGWQDSTDPNPLSVDSDDDGLWDSVELHSNYDGGKNTSMWDADSDDDGISDGDEDVNLNGRLDDGEINPTSPDTDVDDIQDGTEKGVTERVKRGKPIRGTDTTDTKFTPDGDAGATLTDPLNVDTDADGLRDGEEDTNHNGKHEPPETRADKADTDDDGLSDMEEKEYGTNPNKIDTDGDQLSDGVEVEDYGTNPNKPDTDEDELIDGEEVLTYKTDPHKNDTDNDSLKDGVEVEDYGTDPNNSDTDGDGVDDGTEIENGTNPNNIPPKAVIAKSNKTYYVNESVSFDSRSKDEDGFIKEYHWDFGDGSEKSTEEPFAQHAYAEADTYKVKLTVIDNKGESDTNALSVTIKERPNKPPHAVGSVYLVSDTDVVSEGYKEIEVVKGQALKFDGSQSYDEDEDGEIVRYEWVFGDNSPQYEGDVIYHTYTAKGNFVAQLTVTDDDGAENSTTVNIRVQPEPEPSEEEKVNKPADPGIESIEISPRSPKDGDVITAKITVHNYGEEDAEEVFVRIYDEHPDDTGLYMHRADPLYEGTIQTIKAGESRVIQVSSKNKHRLGLVGKHTIRAVIEPEYKDINNNVQKDFKVSGVSGVIYLGKAKAISAWAWQGEYGSSKRKGWDKPGILSSRVSGRWMYATVVCGSNQGGDAWARLRTKPFTFKESTIRKFEDLEDSDIDFVFDMNVKGMVISGQCISWGAAHAGVKIFIEGFDESKGEWVIIGKKCVKWVEASGGKSLSITLSTSGAGISFPISGLDDRCVTPETNIYILPLYSTYLKYYSKFKGRMDIYVGGENNLAAPGAVGAFDYITVVMYIPYEKSKSIKGYAHLNHLIVVPT